MKIEDLSSRHLADAASLVAGRVCELRAQVPDVPSHWERPGAIEPLLEEIITATPGIAALRNGQLVGFVAAYLLPGFRGARTVFSPEWANAALLHDRRRTYEAMYAAISQRWLANGCYTHLICTLAHDTQVIDAFHWLGFGLLATDAVRGLAPLDLETATDVRVRRASIRDVETAHDFDVALRRHLASSPTCLAWDSSVDKSESVEWLSDSGNALWLAERGHQVVGCLGHGPASENACTIIGDQGTTSIVRAYVLPNQRGNGVGAALLDQALSWGREQGYERCAVDFEPMNTPAARFWTRHFSVITQGMVRHVDPRIGWANDQRKPDDIW